MDLAGWRGDLQMTSVYGSPCLISYIPWYRSIYFCDENKFLLTIELSNLQVKPPGPQPERKPLPPPAPPPRALAAPPPPPRSPFAALPRRSAAGHAAWALRDAAATSPRRHGVRSGGPLVAARSQAAASSPRRVVATGLPATASVTDSEQEVAGTQDADRGELLKLTDANREGNPEG